MNSLLNGRNLLVLRNVVTHCICQNEAKHHYPIVTQVRYRHRKIVVGKPRQHHYRLLAELATKPIYPKHYEGKLMEDICSKAVKRKKLEEEGEFIHPIFLIFGEELREVLLNSKLVLFLHVLPFHKEDFFDMKIDFQDINVKYIFKRKPALKVALTGTKYEPLLRLFESNTVIFVSNEPNFRKINKIMKKYPFAIMIGGIFEDRVISISDFRMLIDNSSISHYHSQLSAILAQSGQQLLRSLSHHQESLTGSLQRYITKKSGDTGTISSEPES